MGAPAAWGQHAGRIYRLGFVVQPPHRQFEALFDELTRRGFIEGENLLVDPRGFGLAVNELEVAAVAVVNASPDVIYAGGDAAGRAAQRATATIPIVVLSDDVIRAHLVPSLARPGGNITGISILATELDGKRLELLMEIVPGIRRISALVDPKTTDSEQLEDLVGAARSRGIALSIHNAETLQQIAPAITVAKASGAQAINVLASALFNANRVLIIERIAAARLPAMYQWPEYGAEGALIAYGPRITSMYRQAAQLLVKVMTGIKPGDIPVEQPTRFELMVNLKTLTRSVLQSRKPSSTSLTRLSSDGLCSFRRGRALHRGSCIFARYGAAADRWCVADRHDSRRVARHRNVS
jgi:putative ABC transport system substrate-binding protein